MKAPMVKATIEKLEERLKVLADDLELAIDHNHVDAQVRIGIEIGKKAALLKMWKKFYKLFEE